MDFAAPWRRVTLAEAIREETGIDVRAHGDTDALAAAIGDRLPTADRTWPQLVDDLLSKFVEPELVQPTFVLDYPKELSPFAKDHRSEPGLVERFEAFCGGMEIANAFSELNDPDEQRERFEAQQRLSVAGDDGRMQPSGAAVRLELREPFYVGIGVCSFWRPSRGPTS